MVLSTGDSRYAGVLHAFLLILLLLCLPVKASAVSAITAAPGGDGVFLIQGSGIENAAALEIAVQYDPASLFNPRVAAGPLIAGAMTAVNPNVPGTVRIVAIRLTPFRGSGVIATMTFDRRGPSSGGIIAVTARLADLGGAPLPSTAGVSTPTEAAPASSSGQPATAAASDTSAGPLVVPLPVLVAQGSSTPGVQVSPPAAGADAEPDAGPAGQDRLAMAQISDAGPHRGTAAASPTSRERAVYKQSSVLDRFLAYRGARTREALVKLFEIDSMIGSYQYPPVALSDGRSTIRFVFVSAPGTRTSSDIAVMGAKLLSLRRDPDNTNTWIVELLPDAGAYRASIAVPLGDLQMIYPLTIAPRIDITAGRGGTATGEDFDRYLNGPGSDLNGDGKRDDLDDFLFTANYLLQLSTVAAHRQEPTVLRGGH